MNYMDDVVLLLTACINPNGMLYTTIQDTELRKKHYIESLFFLFNKNSNIKLFLLKIQIQIYLVFIKRKSLKDGWNV
ncbi:hypothetical protein DXA01_25180 [Bacteroides caccae]|nr:hypothetical protein DXA01_25180 [Bacteroides caccae]